MGCLAAEDSQVDFLGEVAVSAAAVRVMVLDLAVEWLPFQARA